jgi:Zn-dependent protease
MPFESLEFKLISFLVICLSIAIHEFAHAKFADLAGDDTPRMLGRVTLNPLKHLDPMGTLFMAITVFSGFGIGWGKPVPMRPERMKNPRWDHFAAVAAGPISNLLQACLYAVILRVVLMAGPQSFPLLVMFCLIGVIINVSLFLFNLIPLGPLDGHWLIGLLMPEKYRLPW